MRFRNSKFSCMTIASRIPLMHTPTGTLGPHSATRRSHSATYTRALERGNARRDARDGRRAPAAAAGRREPTLGLAGADMTSALLLSLSTLASPPTIPTVALQNAAKPGMKMPATGMGTGCAIGGCNWGSPEPFASFNMSRQWLQIGGRRFDGADSYGIEPGIGEAIKQSGIPRSEIFITSKTGPGGLAWPLGYNETLEQARQIVANYSTSYVDLLLIHWPTNYGPCSYHGPKPSIPTTDPACDTAKPTYSAKECRLSTWRAMVQVWKSGLALAIGVSNFNTTHLKEIADAGLPAPSVNQCQFNPSHGLSAKGCTPGSQTETCGELLEYCKAHKIHYQGYSPYGGRHGVAKLLSDPRLKKIAAAHGTGSAQVVLRWQWELGISVNPEARELQYQEENLHFFNFTLSAAEMDILNTWTSIE